MRPRIREIHTRKAPVGFAARLEAEARRIVRRGDAGATNGSTSRILQRRLCLVMDQLDALRKSNARIRKSLDEQEAAIRQEIREREPRLTVYSDSRLPERDMLRGRLLRLGQERRRRLVSENAEMRELQDRLAQLVEVVGRHP